MINSSLLDSNPQTEAAQQCIDRFRQKHGEIYYQFACYAAFPLALTPDFLYRLRNHFYSELPVPWVAIAHLLLSDLCQNIGEELYEMDRNVRCLLLNELTSSELSELSSFSLDYIQDHFKTDIQGLWQAQYWTALAYVKPEPTAQEIAIKLRQLLQKPNFREWLRISSLVETLTEPLQNANFQPLLTLAEAMGKAARGNYTEAEQQFAQLRQNNTVNIAGVSVPLPPPPIPAKTFSFETVTVNKKGEIIKRETQQARYFTEDMGNGITLDMVYIPGGTFLMGSLETEKKYQNYDGREEPQHRVTIPPFFMAKYPITQAQWKAVANWPKIQRDLDPDPSRFKGDNRPVEKVKWYDAVEFCARLLQHTGRNYCLPSEAQWEYACRAGTQTPFYFGETLTSDLANYDGNYTYAEEPKGIYREETTPVGEFPPNAFGLYDLHGNVWEWCADPGHDNYEKAPTQGEVWDEQNKNDNRYQIYNVENLVNLLSHERYRCLRGGSWFDGPGGCRSAGRGRITPGGSNDVNCGFRVCWVVGAS
ncbi:formylglycine-generating enzyme family protein [Planktothrix sp. FACHB-1365]|uniref:formylglycine-generating enzyme family protein n=1 Tax=Planktothrix sp. FACHB-1365 TaxID=2692855 RepID=UPI0016855CDC|nr:formylglycine-generating enzyme family protein [Planktothrix sp. FACHB-1365]MBD2485593.1 formylglycine-generating enzyme family protein [Planktothrix sp. FACHB-1365]